ncbi:MAG: hypothetical protein A2X40_10165 [Elusimicrobia bacterium GWC2_65_9]|nr:MAG: hypothetical protein A2X37_03390 [Elusimicrobia bacterium GWA2_66_18]OGR74366.1 MAG: hypothetical protein A2X40_10165 [Elusimicrobia bacterium GWC2_65_9]
MVVEKTAAKKSISVTLALALGLCLPGGAAWSQTSSARVSVVTARASAASAASIVGVESITVALPVLSPGNSPAVVPFPAASARDLVKLPAAVELHPVIGLINQLQETGVVLPETYSSYADAAKVEAAARALPEGSSIREQLTQLAGVIRASRAGAPIDEETDKRFFDGSKLSATEVKDIPATGLFGVLSGMKRLLPASVARMVAVKKIAAPAPKPADPKTFELSVDSVRYAPIFDNLPQSTREIKNEDKQLVGQDEALKAIRFGLEMKADHYNLFVAGPDGSGRSLALRHALDDIAPKMAAPNDIVAATNFADKDVPVFLQLAAGRGEKFAEGVAGFVSALKENLPREISAGETGQKKRQILATLQAAEQEEQAEFDKKIASIKLVKGKFGVYFAATRTEKGMQISLAVSHEGKAMAEEDVAAKVGAGAFTQAEFAQARAELAQEKSGIIESFKAMMQAKQKMTQKVQGFLEQLDAKAAAALVTEFANQLVGIAVSGPSTAEAEALKKRAQERDEELREAMKLLGGKKFGKFGAEVKIGMGANGPVVVAALVFDGQRLSDQVAAEMIAAGKFPRGAYAKAFSALSKKAKAIQDKMAEYVAATQKEAEALQAKKPAATLESRQVVAYIQDMAQFAAANYKIFLGGLKESEEKSGLKPVPGMPALAPADFFRVSVLVDNAGQQGAPVVFEENPSYERLFGYGEDNARSMIIPGAGIVKTAAPGGPTLKGGSFLKANGGFLILNAMDVLKSPGAWPALMRAVRSGKAEITEGGLVGLASLKGDVYEVPGKVKVVLIGSPMIQMLLAAHDEDFAANFQSVAQFQPTIKITKDAVGGFLNFFKRSVGGSAGEIMDMTRDAISRVLQQAARLADSNRYFTSQFGALHGLLQEATYWARKAGRTVVAAEDVETALKAKTDREDVHYQRMSELYRENIIRVETTGSAVGQVTALAVMGSHGMQMRMTFVAGPGPAGIVSVDHQAGATGPSFNKALGNEYSFLMHEFGEKKALKAQIRVSYEQSYGKIDGDSSTAATLYGILSALSDAPISQKFSVTGSADQFGNVQAIGGVNEKIEGFFDLCSHRGLTGDQGVIIPKTNVGDLQLSPEVAQAVKDGKFHIYAVDTVAQGMEILTGTAYQTIKAKAADRLDEIAKVK